MIRPIVTHRLPAGATGDPNGRESAYLQPSEASPLRKLRHPDRLGLHVRVVLENGIAIGPGRAELLEAIRDTGSISAAGRMLAMSYKRAWDLVEDMNLAFVSPLIQATTGGPSGGGSRLTPAGETVLAAYRSIETMAAEATSKELRTLTALLAPPEKK